MMNYDEFKDFVVNELSCILKGMGKVCTTQFTDVKKTNAVYEGLVYRDENVSVNVSPTINVTKLYEDYQQGASESKIVDSLKYFVEHGNVEGDEIKKLGDWEAVKSNVFLAILNKERNLEMLEDTVYYDFLDFVVICKILVNMKESANGKSINGSVLVKDSLLSLYGIAKEELFKTAYGNTKNILQFEIRDMFDIIKQTKGGDMDIDMSLMGEDIMKVIFTKDMIYGSSAMLYNDIFDEIAKSYHSNLVILPSSLHELIVIPAVENNDYEFINGMIHEVNEEQLAPEDFLSDHAYYYSVEKGQVLIPEFVR